MACFLNKIVKPLTFKSPYFISDSKDFVSKIKDKKLKRGCSLVSLDAVSLFTKVPIQLTLEYIKDKLSQDDAWKIDKHKLDLQDIIMLVEICLEGNYFQWEGVYYEQLEGSAMGSPISSIFAEFFMQRLEFQMINTMTSIKLWYRYVDDVYRMVSTNDIDRISAKLNDFNQSIFVTHEIMSNNSLLFLDNLV